MLTNLAVSLLLTVLLEELFALAWGLRGRWELAMAALMNCLTNPVVVLLRYTAVYLWRWDALPVTAALEAAAVLVEWRCCKALSRQLRHPFRFALLVNVFSYLSGCLLNFLWRFL